MALMRSSHTQEGGLASGKELPLPSKRVPAVDRALSVMEMLATSQKGMTLAAIARNLQIHRSSAHYIVSTMEARGYLYRASVRGRYTYTAKLFDLANKSLIGVNLREQAASSLRSLAERVGMTVHMAVVSQSEIVLIHKMQPHERPTLATWIGKRLPIHCTGVGKALMAYMPQSQADDIIRRGLIRYNENTIVSSAKLKQELLKVRQQGFAVDDEEETLGLRCIGVPVLQGPEAVAAISIAGTIAEIHDGNLDALVLLAKESADEITLALSGEPDTTEEQ
jgi:DNA-binding IclR family transcriptional regulator